MQPDHAQPQPLAFLRRNCWSAVRTVATAGVGVYLLSQGNPIGLAFLAVVAVSLGADWLLSRTGTRLDKPEATSLLASVESQPAQVSLVDRETDDILRITPKRLLGMRLWRVDRFPDFRRIIGEIEEDFAAGRVSTMACTSYLVDKRRISAVDHVLPVCVGDRGNPEPYSLPGSRRHATEAWFRIRTGSSRVDRQTVADLIAQLRRVEPLNQEPEDEHAAA